MLKRYTHKLLTKSIHVAMLFMTTTIYAQNNFQRDWDHRYGGTLNEKLKVFLPTEDSGYILGGTSFSGMNGDKSQPSRGAADYYVVKTDQFGVKQWDATFGGSLEDELTALIQTSDGGFLLGGYSRSAISGDKTEDNWDVSGHDYPDYWIVKIDAHGVKQWDKRFGGIYDDRMTSLIKTKDDGYLLGGYSESSVSGDKSEASYGGPDYWIVKITASGNKVWDKRFGGGRNDQLIAMTPTTDGNYLLAGITWSDVSNDVTEANRGMNNYDDYWVIKVDATGNKMWDKRYGGTVNDNLTSVIETNDRGFLLNGYSYSSIGGDKTGANYGAANTSDQWLVKTDNLGNLVWDKTIGGLTNENKTGNVTQNSDNGYFLATASYSPISGDKTEANQGQNQTWLVKLDELGNVLWDKTLFTSGRDDVGFAYLQNDGSVVAANYSNGTISGYKTESNYDVSLKYCDFWIMRLVNAVPPVADFVNIDPSVCSRECVDFTNLSANASSYLWSFPGATPSTSTLRNPTNICYNTAGDFDVTLIVQNNFGSDTMVLQNYMHIVQSPMNVTLNLTAGVLYAPTGYSTYEWYYNGVLIPFEHNNYLTPQLEGDYTVVVGNENNCEASAHLDYVMSSVNDLSDVSNSVSVYPNPAGDNFVISMNDLDSKKAVTVSVFDQVSKLVFTEKLNPSSAELKYIVNSTSMKAGLYWIRVTNGDKMIRKSIVITK